ncbi:alpha-amylase family protein [Chitinophaga filiformis]|uniref:Alpha-amylase family protein n=1 Tax=Chitinophaga filiformis TaxID=104663 RepID=A0ABY4HZX0_CHIFI|nr:alpha-amylase family protein [Chitinophaga filiformis]UPK69102.1 alpha-amylase family protein [Chitinophaga filiformis]
MKKQRFLLLAILLCTALSAFAQYPDSSISKDLWYKNTIIYNLEIGTFKDSDGNGTGDIEGLIQQLDYLTALGINTVWLAPFQPSPRKDDGYDVSDYYGIDTTYGTGGHFAELMYQARKRGIRIMMDIVLNHTSDQHPWFKAAAANPTSKYHDYYSWSKKRPAIWNKGMAFPGVQTETWTYNKEADAYYYHRFYDFQPDLNFMNPMVKSESKRILGYWLNQGVSGFRLDAVPFIIEKPGSDPDKPEHDLNIIPEIRRFVQWRNGEALILGEANVIPEENNDYFGKDGSGMHTMFNFYANQYLFYALATGDIAPLKKALQDTRDIPPTSQWMFFLRNHDEIDLGRLTDKQREKVYQQFGPEKNMQLYDRGIRRRLAPMLGGNRARLEMAYSLLFSLPGTPVIRYGDEIGMGDNLNLKERLAVRTPMQWTNGKNAGFSTAGHTFRPVIDTGAFAYQQVNVAVQQRDPASLLNWTINIIRLRKECPEIGLGKWQILETNTPGVLVMRYDLHDKTLITIHNFSNTAQKVKFSAPDARYYNLTGHDVIQTSQGTFTADIPEYGYSWYRMENFR